MRPDPSATIEVKPPGVPPGTPAHSRRRLLAGALGGLAAALVGAFGRPSEADAAAGGNMIIGSETNNAGSANTQLLTNSNVVAFKLLQQGPGTALMGYVTPASGATRGVYGRSDSSNGFGVQARNAGTAGAGAGVQAIGGQNYGIDATTDKVGGYAIRAIENGGGGIGVYGESADGAGVAGHSSGNYGLRGTSFTGTGVWAQSTSGAGVYGYSSSYSGVRGDGNTGYGVWGFSVGNAGVFGQSSGSYAGYFEGSLYATSANASIKAFRIDHPIDPAGKVLVHSCVESNERLTVYAGIARTGEGGEATVELPTYFSTLNRDIRYQLTVIGSFAGAMIKSKVRDNRFTIATSEPGIEVSWQISGVRQDAYSKAHPLVVESAKTGREKGRYINPIEHGQPESAGVVYHASRGLPADQPTP